MQARSILDGALAPDEHGIGRFEIHGQSTSNTRTMTLRLAGREMHDFSYVVFVRPLGKKLVHLDEFRDGAGNRCPVFSDVITAPALTAWV